MRKWLIIAATIFGVDQLSKFAAEDWLTPYTPVPITSWFNLNLVYNTGAAFSLLSEAGGWQRWFFVTITLIICVILINWLRQLQDSEVHLGIGITMILGGALGNLYDRLIYGHVVDFLDLYYASYHWPTFNIADASVTGGALLIIAITLSGKNIR